MPSFIKYLHIFFLLLFSGIRLSGQQANLHYSLRKEVITVRSMDEGYTSGVYCRGKYTSLEGRETAIVYSELEALGGLVGRYQNSKGKYKDLPEANIHNSAVIGGSFYAGLNQYVLSWPSKGDPELRFLYTYKVNCKELMTLSALNINDIDRTDTFEYEIRVPKGILLYYRLPPNSEFLKADSSETEAGKTYHFIACPPEKITLQRKLQDYEYNAYPTRFLQLAFVPEAYSGKAWNWLNDWYKSILRNQSGLNTESKKMFERIIGNATDPDSIAAKVFNYVKTKITYLDVENGLGAFRPREANDVLANRQGDCKDMANLICEVLQANGLEAYRAISSTLSYDVDLNFPSLSSGNHMICVARIRNKWVFLDGTDAVCPYGFPSMHIQGRKLFLIKGNTGELIQVPIIDAGRNKTLCDMRLQDADNHLRGSFSYSYEGLSRHDEKEAKFTSSADDYNSISRITVESNFHHTAFANFSRTENDSVLVLHGQMDVTHVEANLGKKSSLSLSFLPFPHKYPRPDHQGTQIITYQAFDNRFICRIEFENKIHIQDFDSIRFSKGSFQFSFHVQQTGPQSVMISYEYIYTDVVIPATEIPVYDELNDLISETLKKSLIYE